MRDCLRQKIITVTDVFARRDNASEILKEYLESVGGREKIIEDSQTATKTKKRGRPSGTPVNGSNKKSRRTGSHPASATPPASVTEWRPPAGSWENDVAHLDARHDENTGRLVVYLTWKNGQKTQHDTKIIYARCPQQVTIFCFARLWGLY